MFGDAERDWACSAQPMANRSAACLLLLGMQLVFLTSLEAGGELEARTSRQSPPSRTAHNRSLKKAEDEPAEAIALRNDKRAVAGLRASTRRERSDDRQFNVSERLWSGYCGTHTETDTAAAPPCKSSFQQPDTPTTMGSCALGCLHCDNCRYATFSQKMSDCSLYSACDLSRLAQGHGYSTLDTANLGAGALVAALGGVPPPPPPSFPREPGSWSDAACAEPANASRPVFAVFGGSNSAGTNSLQYNMRSPKNPITYGRRLSSFADELMLRLQPTFRLSGRYVGGGMGPTAAAACVSRFAPAETRLATVEFLPNIGYVKDDTGELESIGELLRVLRARGAATYVVDVISGSIRYEREARFQGWCGKYNASAAVDESVRLYGCNTRQQILHLHTEIAKLARIHGAELVTVDADESPHLFGADYFHMNAAGHRHVANEIWRHYKRLPCTAFRPASHQGRHTVGMECAIAEDMDQHVGHSAGFARVNLGGDRGVSKIGYDAQAPGASLDFCVQLPRQAAQGALAELDRVTVQTQGANRHNPRMQQQQMLHGDAYALSLGVQTSHYRNRPLHGRAFVSCHGACACTCLWAHAKSVSGEEDCIFDTIQNASAVTVVKWLRLAARERAGGKQASERACGADDRCVLRVRNGGEGETRHRVVVRALMWGLNDWRFGDTSQHQQVASLVGADLRVRM